ncbi:MAG TPA: histidine kinase dimerization/phosphoacceptor domain -containing protein [Spirochaetia bacterium]|nr:histidine kinase dimerization/phosphoacceptor domain -containing protein [Spirochaetales bacterium]HRY79195.1 histidine kinase dimerization/phosphoacceptor domain -containing protein [Spirochaetia bacterium]
MRERFRVTSFLGTLFSVIVLSSLSIMGVSLERFVRADLTRHAEESNGLLAASVAHEISAFLDLHFMGLSLLRSRDFRPKGVDLLHEAYPAFDTVLFTDSSGRVSRASMGSGDAGFDFSFREYFRIPFETGADFVSRPFVSGIRYTPSAVLAHPIPDGVAIGYIDLGFLGDFLSSLPSSQNRSISVVDDRGAFVAHNSNLPLSGREDIAGLEPWFRERDIQAGSGSTLVTRREGSEELLSWASTSGPSGWTVIVSEPSARVFASLLAFRISLVLVLVAYAVLSLPLILGSVRLVRRDLAALARFSQDIAEGRTEAVLTFKGFRDFSLLASNLVRMGRAIGERETRLRENERRLLETLDFMPVPVILLARDQRMELMNRAFSSVFGWAREDIDTAEKWWSSVYPDPRYREEVRTFWQEYIDRLGRGERTEAPFRGRLRCKDGSCRSVVGQAALIAEGFVVTYVDMTESEQAAERTAASLREKEILLKEIHHRVKNNLQVVTSLLSLQASGDPEQVRLFSDSINRIQVMAGIHELLYRSRDLAHIDLAEYGETIVHWLASTYSVGSSAPELELRMDRIELDIDKAVPCGLIMNEILTNTLKYAFPPDHPAPRIRVRAARDTEGFVVLELSDNGTGLPPDFDPERSSTLGFLLIRSLCQQIRGSWSLDRSGGTGWTIRFPV